MVIEQIAATFFPGLDMAQACPTSCQGEWGTSELVPGSKPGLTWSHPPADWL